MKIGVCGNGAYVASRVQSQGLRAISRRFLSIFLMQHISVANVGELMTLRDRIKEYIFDAGALQRNLADAMVAQAVE